MPLNSPGLTRQASAGAGDAAQLSCVSKGLKMGDRTQAKISASRLDSQMPEHASVFFPVTHFFLT